MAQLLQVKGLSELQKLLDTLPAKVEANILRGALRAGMKPVLEEARENAARDTGEMADGLKVGTKKKGVQVVASIAAKGPHGFLAPFVEFGTAGHTIPGPLVIGGVTIRAVDHPGARAKPFMRPALDARAQDAVLAAGEYMKQRLAKKEGLDTSHIMLEGDEE
jgi:HK97 gp10 family phage protein